jgi:hypothetical protein
MYRMTIHLPNVLAKQIREQGLVGKSLDRFVVAAIQMRMREHGKQRREKQKALKVLRKAGLALSAVEQREFADAVLARLSARKEPVTRSQVEKSLAQLRSPLSAEILAMRGER